MALNELSSTPSSSSDQDKMLSWMIDGKWDPEDLRTIPLDSLSKYIDLVKRGKEYKDKLDKWEAVERDEELWSLIERGFKFNTNNALKISNLKDIAYVTYFRLTRKKMPWYDYKWDHPTKDQKYHDKFPLTISTDEYNLYITQELYQQPKLKLWFGYPEDSDYINIKHNDDYDWLWGYLTSAKSSIDHYLKEKVTFFNQGMIIFVIKLRYMLEVADRLHDTADKKALQYMIEYTIDAMKTIQNNGYEALEAKKKKEDEQSRLLEYVNKNNLDLEQIIALQDTVKKMESEMKMLGDKDSENKDLVLQLEALHKRIADLFALFLDDILPNLKKNTFSKWYTLPNDVVAKIQEWAKLLEQENPKK